MNHPESSAYEAASPEISGSGISGHDHNGYMEFDAFTCPLSGVNLVEASAGTGKTYSITSIYLRFILECGFQVENILVVTFTEAATEELKDRIRTRLRECLESLKTGVFKENDTFQAYFEGLDENIRANASRRLEEAVRSFDRASVFTIHGFCMRVLREMAFETGAMSDFNLEADMSELDAEIISDYLRMLFRPESVSGFPDSFFKYLVKQKFFSGYVEKLLSGSKSFPKVFIGKMDAEYELHDIWDIFEKARSAASVMWGEKKSEITECLMAQDVLKASSYREDIKQRILDSIDRYIETAEYDFFITKDFRKISLSSLVEGTKKGKTPPHHDFFILCERLTEASENLEKAFISRFNSLKQEFMDYYYSESAKRKETRKVLGFNDLLTRLHEAVSGSCSANVCSGIRRKFHAALVDEFQDTDHIQYDIFSTAFRNHVPLFLIGDPKQSIYGFRGADVFAYIRAASEADRKYTLTTNWRSDSGLIMAVNHLFSIRENPFVLKDIQYFHVKPSPEKAGASAFRSDMTDYDTGFLEIFAISKNTLNTGNTGNIKNNPEMIICEYVARSVAELLSGNAEIDGRPVAPCDIAVLVDSHKHGRKIRSCLERAGIPSVSTGGDSVFSSVEALYMARLIGAVINPSDIGRLKGALVTPFFGFTAHDIEKMNNNPELFEKSVVVFRDLHDLWLKKSFMRMFRAAMKRDGVLAGMAGRSDGERTLTNLFHIAEIINHEEISFKLCMDEVLDMLIERINSSVKGAEEELLRLESDSDAVRIMTVHKSKGLEFPVVFCPFPVRDLTDKGLDKVVVHDSDDDFSFTYFARQHPDFDIKRKRHQTAELAESARLLYVALTRAKHRCFLAVDMDKCLSSLGYLLFHRGITGEDDGFSSLSGYLQSKGNHEEKYEKLEKLCFLSENTVSLSNYDPAASYLSNFGLILHDVTSTGLRKAERIIATGRTITSFSALTSRIYTSSTPDPDIPETYADEADNLSTFSVNGARAVSITGSVNDTENAARTVFDFPKGAEAGNFFHSFLERLDFRSDYESIRAHAEKILPEFGFEASWSDVIAEMTSVLLDIRLPHTDFTFSSIDRESRINEAGFYFPLGRMTPKNLAEAFADIKKDGRVIPEFTQSLEKLGFYPVSGFMRGFIDMIFHKDGRYYIVDWKSNHLGNSCEAYSAEALEDAMISEYYILQYYLYVIAVSRYLEGRIPGYSYNDNFGGVYYIFLRGTEGQGKYGIYYDRPDEAFIKKLSSGIFA